METPRKASLQRVQRLSYMLLAASLLLSIQMSWARTANFSIIPNYQIQLQAPRINTSLGDYEVRDPKLFESYRLLQSTISGSRIAQTLSENRVQILFGQPRTQGMAAVYVPAPVPIVTSGTIIIGYDYKEAPSNVLAALIAHEAIHAKMDTFFGEDSVDQEYRAYLAQAAVWKELRNSIEIPAAWYAVTIHETSPENDFAVRVSEMPKDEAFKLIYESYLRLGVELPYE